MKSHPDAYMVLDTKEDPEETYTWIGDIKSFGSFMLFFSGFENSIKNIPV